MRSIRGLAPLVALVCGCFNPSLGDQPFKCGVAPDECPPDYTCSTATGFCLKTSGTQIDGGARKADAPPAPDGPRNPDGFVCNGGAFVSCKDPSTALFCNAGGNGEVEQACEAGCDGSLHICKHCVPSTTTCSGDTLGTCDVNGQPGDAVTCAAGCDASAAPAACWVLSPTNLLPSACDRASLGAHDFAGDVAIDTSNCVLSGGVVLPQSASGPELCIFRFTNVMLEAGARVTFSGGRVPVVVATDNMMIAGTIEVGGKGATGGPGSNAKATTGRGASGGCGGDQGGGGGGHLTSGGQGGAGQVTTSQLPGGDAFGPDALSPILAGGYGGAGGYPSIEVCQVKDSGGGGGGAIQLVSCGGLTITATAVIDAGGGGGAGGAAPVLTDPPGGGDGGGAGGAILIEAPVVAIPVGAQIGATGGGGGGGAAKDGTASGSVGKPGDDGAPGGKVAAGGKGSGDSSGSGGVGGAGDVPKDGGGGSGAGGGGGAAGRIRINSRPDKPPTINGTVTPGASTGSIQRHH